MTTTNEWCDLLSMKDVANAKDAGDEIEVGIVGRSWQIMPLRIKAARRAKTLIALMVNGGRK